MTAAGGNGMGIAVPITMSSEQSLDAAMERFAEGDDDAFRVIYDALAPRLRGFLRRFAGGDVEDLVQQTFLQIHVARGTFIAGARVKPWAYAIARRLLIDRMRREKSRALRTAQDLAGGSRLAPTALEGPDERLFALELARDLEARIRELPTARREVIELTRGEGISTRETANLLGITVAAVKLRSARAMKTLRDAVAVPVRLRR